LCTVLSVRSKTRLLSLDFHCVDQKRYFTKYLLLVTTGQIKYVEIYYDTIFIFGKLLLEWS